MPCCLKMDCILCGVYANALSSSRPSHHHRTIIYVHICVATSAFNLNSKLAVAENHGQYSDDGARCCHVWYTLRHRAIFPGDSKDAAGALLQEQRTSSLTRLYCLVPLLLWRTRRRLTLPATIPAGTPQDSNLTSPRSRLYPRQNLLLPP